MELVGGVNFVNGEYLDAFAFLSFYFSRNVPSDYRKLLENSFYRAHPFIIRGTDHFYEGNEKKFKTVGKIKEYLQSLVEAIKDLRPIIDSIPLPKEEIKERATALKTKRLESAYNIYLERYTKVKNLSSLMRQQEKIYPDFRSRAEKQLGKIG